MLICKSSSLNTYTYCLGHTEPHKMTVSIRRLLFLAGLCPLASAVTMKLYQPAADVDAGFETFLQTYVFGSHQSD